MKRRRDSATDLQELSSITTSIPYNTPKKPRMSIDLEQGTLVHGQTTTASADTTVDSAKAQALHPLPPHSLPADPIITILPADVSATSPSRPTTTSAVAAKKTPRLKQTAALKRSVSTPHFHVGTDMSALGSSHTTPTGTGIGDAAESPDTVEKQRNKLGYHRTSVACGHCRRRKIRCLLAPGDSQGRCTNCIRLKKECFFFPVDQTAPVEKRSKQGRSGDPASRRLSTASSSTPPPLMSGPLTAQSDPFSQYTSLPSTSHYEFAGQYASGPGLGLIGTESKFGPCQTEESPSFTRNTSRTDLSHGLYTHSFDTSEAWDPLYQHRFSMSGQLENLHQDAGQEYWKMSEPQLSAAHMAATQHPQKQHGQFGGSSRNEIGWLGSSNNAQRSLSLGNIGDAPDPYNVHTAPERSSTMNDVKQRHATAAQAFGGPAPTGLPPSLSTSATSSSTSLSEVRSLPLSAPIRSNRAHGLASFEGWSPYHMQYHFSMPDAKGSVASAAGAAFDASSHWYQEPMPLDPVPADHGETVNVHSQLPQQHQQRQHDQPQYFGDRFPGVSSLSETGPHSSDFHHHDTYSSG